MELTERRLSLRRLDYHYIAMQAGFWAMFAAIVAYQTALLLERGFSNSEAGLMTAARCLAGDKVPPYGARELRRTVSRAVEQALADRIAAGTARAGAVYTADAGPDGTIVLQETDLAACV